MPTRSWSPPATSSSPSPWTGARSPGRRRPRRAPPPRACPPSRCAWASASTRPGPARASSCAAARDCSAAAPTPPTTTSSPPPPPRSSGSTAMPSCSTTWTRARCGCPTRTSSSSTTGRTRPPRPTTTPIRRTTRPTPRTPRPRRSAPRRTIPPRRPMTASACARAVPRSCRCWPTTPIPTATSSPPPPRTTEARSRPPRPRADWLCAWTFRTTPPAASPCPTRPTTAAA